MTNYSLSLRRARISAIMASKRASSFASSASWRVMSASKRESIFASSLSCRASSASKRASSFASSLSIRAVFAAIAPSSRAVFAAIAPSSRAVFAVITAIKTPASAISAPSSHRIIRFSAPRTSAFVASVGEWVSKTATRSSIETVRGRTASRARLPWKYGAVGAVAVLAMTAARCLPVPYCATLLPSSHD